MNPDSSSRVAVATLLLSALLAPVSPARAVATRSPLTIPAVALVDGYPDERSLVASIVRGSVTTPGAYGVGLTGLHLPDGARITALAATVVDESPDEELELRIFRRRISTTELTGQELALVTTSGASPALQSIRTEAVTLGTIDNSLYVYWVAARLEDDVELFGVQVEFLTPLFVDGFESGDTAAWGDPAGGYVSPWAVNFADAIPQSLDTNGCWYLGSTGSTAEAVLSALGEAAAVCCFVAPVHLPDGVEVTAVVFYLGDGSADDFTMSLRRKRLGTQTVATPMGTVTTSGSGNNVRLFADGTIDDGVVDNGLYTYFVSSDSCLDQQYDLRFYQALIFYSE